jgi:hypothetical protein
MLPLVLFAVCLYRGYGDGAIPWSEPKLCRPCAFSHMSVRSSMSCCDIGARSDQRTALFVGGQIWAICLAEQLNLQLTSCGDELAGMD